MADGRGAMMAAMAAWSQQDYNRETHQQKRPFWSGFDRFFLGFSISVTAQLK